MIRAMSCRTLEIWLEFSQAHPKLVGFQQAELVDFHLGPPLSAEVTNRVLIGSLAAASFMASFAT